MSNMTVEPSEHTCGLYLCVQAGSGTPDTERIAALLDPRQIACLLITPPPNGDIDSQKASALSKAAQTHQIATLIQDNAQLAQNIQADGVHLSWSDDILERFAKAKEIIGEEAILGADAGRSRHIAMSLGEAGSHYIAFGIPEFVSDIEKAKQRQLELIQWWGEIFEIPSVAFNVDNPVQFQMLVSNKADFIATMLPQGKTAADLKHWLETQQLALTINTSNKETGENKRITT